MSLPTLLLVPLADPGIIANGSGLPGWRNCV